MDNSFDFEDFNPNIGEDILPIEEILELLDDAYLSLVMTEYPDPNHCGNQLIELESRNNHKYLIRGKINGLFTVLNLEEEEALKLQDALYEYRKTWFENQQRAKKDGDRI